MALDTSSGTCFDFEEILPISSLISANNELRLVASSEGGYGPTLTIDAIVSPDRSSIVDGTYQISSKGCANGYSGTVTATRINAVEGRYVGTLSKGDSSVFLTADLVQAKLADPVSGAFQISGNLIMTGPACAGTFNLSGGAIGNRINFYSSSGTGLEGLSARVDTTGQQLTLDDYAYSDDCTAGYKGVLQRE